MYNLTNLSINNATNFWAMTVGVNKMTNNYLAILILLAIFYILIITFKREEEDFKKTVLVASTLTSIISTLFWFGKLISWEILIIPIIIMITSIMLVQFSK